MMHALRSSFGRVIVPAALYLPLSGCSLVAHITGGFESPVIELAASKVESISLAGAHLLFTLAVSNPNAYALEFHALRYRLTVNGTVVAEDRAALRATAPPRASAMLHLPIEVRLDRLSNAAQGTLLLGEIPYDLDVRLSADSWRHEHEVALSVSSVLRLNLPLGLARAAATVAFLDTRWHI